MTGFTQEQYNNINNAFSNNDRTRAYILINEYTGCSVAKDMSQISHFSGIIGGVAEKANQFAKDYGEYYPPEGVEKFSKDVADSVQRYITKIDLFRNSLLDLQIMYSSNQIKSKMESFSSVSISIRDNLKALD